MSVLFFLPVRHFKQKNELTRICIQNFSCLLHFLSRLEGLKIVPLSYVHPVYSKIILKNTNVLTYQPFLSDSQPLSVFDVVRRYNITMQK